MSDSKEVSRTEVAPKQGKRAACKRHCRKWWWLHLIIFIIGAIVIVVVAIFAVTPRIAQDKIDAANLEITAIAITNPKPNGFHMKITSHITTDGQVKADIDPFEGSMYLEGRDKPFLVLPFPATNANKYQDVVVDQDIEIRDMAEFTAFNEAFIQKENLSVTIKGYTYVQPKGLTKKYGVNFVKTLEFKGLNLFKGNKVRDARSKLIVQDGPNFFAIADLPNPSYYTIDLGNATFENLAPAPAKTPLGTIFIQDFFLKPGMNSVNVVGMLDLTSVSALALDKTNCDKELPFILVGKQVSYNGANISYFADSLAKSEQVVDINLTRVGASDPNLGVVIGGRCPGLASLVQTSSSSTAAPSGTAKPNSDSSSSSVAAKATA